MRDTIDCLFIGHNEMDFGEYEKSVREMGVNSGVYRDLKLNFIRYNNRPYSASGIFNVFCRTPRHQGSTFKPLSVGEIFSPAIAYLGTYLNNRGFTFDYVNSFQDNKARLAEKLQQKRICAIAIITTLYVSLLPILEIIKFIKTYNRDAKIILGGPFVSTRVRIQEPMTLEYLFGTTIEADFYVNSSQGEATLVEILSCLKNNKPIDRVNNIYYKTGPQGRLESTPPLKENNQLSENMVNWDLFAHDLGEIAAVRTSISCPFSCAFCGFPQHAGTFQTLEPGLVEKELNHLAKLGVKILSFTDDTFNVPGKRFKEILKIMIKNQYNFKWYSYLRCQYADGEIIRLMKESGCQGVFLGLESGNNQILKNMNKKTKTGDYLRGIELLKEYGITTFGSFIIGFPGETAETVQDTVKFIRESGLDFYRCQLWYCEPITPIWKQKDKFNIKGNSFGWSHSTMNWRTASDLIDDIFKSVKDPIFIPQYNFDFNGIWHLIHRGMSLEEVKEFLGSFNEAIKEKLETPGGQEVSSKVIRGLKNSCAAISNFDDSFNQKKGSPDKYNITFNFG